MSPTHTLAQTGILSLITDAGWVAKFILLILLGASVTCWAVIFNKWSILRAAFKNNKEFMDLFWSGKNIEEVVTRSEKMPKSPISVIFNQGIRELRMISAHDAGSPTDSSERIDNIHRALIRASSQELTALERNLGWLATTASAAPFVGLFGTVWGIMTAFQSIGASGGANLAIVAPGISEALITTATGIAAAIPAVVAYNSFSGQIRRVAVDMECFTQDLVNIIQRNFLNSKKGT